MRRFQMWLHTLHTVSCRIMAESPDRVRVSDSSNKLRSLFPHNGHAISGPDNALMPTSENEVNVSARGVRHWPGNGRAALLWHSEPYARSGAYKVRSGLPHAASPRPGPVYPGPGAQFLRNRCADGCDGSGRWGHKSTHTAFPPVLAESLPHASDASDERALSHVRAGHDASA
jgi:hypothetical protein